MPEHRNKVRILSRVHRTKLFCRSIFDASISDYEYYVRINSFKKDFYIICTTHDVFYNMDY